MDTLSPNELSIRKWWMRFFLLTILIEIVGFVKNLDAPQTKTAIIGAIVFGLLYKLAIYYFGYRKMGVRFLTFVVALFGLGITLQTISFILLLTGSTSPFAQVAYLSFMKTPIFSALGLTISIAFTAMCIQLRKINKLRKQPVQP